MGAVGGILALANIAPDECVQIQKFIDEKNFQEALKLQLRLLTANKAVTAKYGIAGLKAAMDMLGYFGGKPRTPLNILNSAELDDLKSILINSNIIKNLN